MDQNKKEGMVMSKGLLASVAVLLAGAGMALAQTPAAPSGTIVPGPVMTTVPGDGPIMNGCMPNGLNCGNCDGEGDCCCQQWYGRGEYLLMWTKGSSVSAPLVTSVAPGTPTGGSPIPGAVGGAGTTVIMGDSDTDFGPRQGGRFTLGRWFDPQQTVAIEGSYFFLGVASDTQSAISLGGPAAPTLMLPFYDVTGTFTGGTPGQSALLPALGHLFNVTGGLNGPFITHDTLYQKSALEGADGYGVFNLAKSGRLRIDGLFGFRWLNLDDRLGFSTYNETTAQAPEHIVFNAGDLFETSNNFYGGLLGLRAEYAPDDGRGGWRGGFCYRADFLLALGDTVERININGGSQTNLGNPPLASPVNYAGGVFTQLSNMGAHDNNQFAVVPEANLSFGYAFASWGRVMIGYDFLYISDVAQPGSQIDPGVNVYRSGVVQAASPPITVPATDPARPAYSAAQSTYWAQGLTFGVELHF
jgi:hypothetical protein